MLDPHVNFIFARYIKMRNDLCGKVFVNIVGVDFTFEYCMVSFFQPRCPSLVTYVDIMDFARYISATIKFSGEVSFFLRPKAPIENDVDSYLYQFQ